MDPVATEDSVQVSEAIAEMVPVATEDTVQEIQVTEATEGKRGWAARATQG